MASSARLERHRRLVKANLDALPDRSVIDDESTGGMSLEPPQFKKPTTELSNAEPPVKEAIVAATDTERGFVWVHGAESSYNPRTMMSAPSKLPKLVYKLAVTDLRRGDLVSARQHFTPIQALAKYPYKFCDRVHMQDIASAFFDHGKFWEREWDLYYIWDVEPTQPIILILESQAQALLKEINNHLKLSLRFTDQQREEGLVTCFSDHPRCLPRYLGRSSSREEYDSMVNNTPSDNFRAAGEPTPPPLQGRSLEDFKQLMEELWDVQKAKSKATKAKKQQDRLIKQKSMVDQFKRTQRYLGLRLSASSGQQSGSASPIDPMLPAPFTFDQSVVFVCVDVESYEKAHHKITEVGVATLDTRDLLGVAPGVDGASWRTLIRARHFRVKEYRHLVNRDHVTGCPDNFEFGLSTDVRLNDTATHVAACFQAPFGAHPSNGAPGIATLMSKIDINEKRNIIFLGHDTLGDVRYLQQLGYDPMKAENIVEALDTAIMYRVWRREQQATSLGKILHAFDIAGFYLHNAGNDAVYTVQAMLAICVREATIRGSPKLDNMRSKEKASRSAAAMEEAQQRVKDDAEGWSDNEAEGDGGAPVPLAAYDTPKPVQAQASSQYNGSSDLNSRGNSHGRGRGQGGSAYGYSVPNDNYHGAVRSGYRASSRGQMDGGRGRGPGHFGGRGRGSFEPNDQTNYNW